MSMPDPSGSMHNASLVYQVRVSEVMAAAGPVSFTTDLSQFTFNFETGRTQNQDGSVTVTWDTSVWSPAVEATIAATLDAICAALAAELGVATAVVQAAVTVKRVWLMAPNIQGPGFSSGSSSITTMMTYPVPPTQVASSDAGSAAEDAVTG